MSDDQVEGPENGRARPNDEDANALSSPSAQSSKDPAQVWSETMRRLAALGAKQAFETSFQNLPSLQNQATREMLERLVATNSFSDDYARRLAAALSTAGIAESAFEQTRRLMRGSQSLPSLYQSLADASPKPADEKAAPSRGHRDAEAFFSSNEAVLDDLRRFLRALWAVQTKHQGRRLYWRGQQDTGWPVRSSLRRRLNDEGREASEDAVIETEVAILESARRWNQVNSRPLELFANLQHEGAPTRLLDVTLDPEVALWFAVQADPEHDDRDGRLIAWGGGTSAAPAAGELDHEHLDHAPVPFWHAWSSDSDRVKVDWGTGTKTWSWFPHPLSERMRAQRAGFLLEPGPIVSEEIAALFSEALQTDWLPQEIVDATSIVGIPARHDVRYRSGAKTGNVAPLFSFRIPADSKPKLRSYLEGKGIEFASLYPDFSGLVAHLRGPQGFTDARALRT